MKFSVYYNELDGFKAFWLLNLQEAKIIPEGFIETRSIEDVKPKEVAAFQRCHFFAGVGGWAIALEASNWPKSVSVWTGSCPCQPFSEAGKREWFADERHLWPAWFHLINQCKPDVVFGEQVAGSGGLRWLDLVANDLEGAGYAFAAANLCAASVGAPHIRQRLFFGAVRLEYTYKTRFKTQRQKLCQSVSTRAAITTSLSGWHDCDWLECRDGKYRPTEPSVCPLADGFPNATLANAAYGDAIVPQVALMFIKAFKEVYL